jgi:hypothetical protein
MSNGLGTAAGLGTMSLGGLGLGALASFLPGLLGSLGLFGEDPRKKQMREIQKLLAPQNMAKLTQQFYQQGLGSPAFAQGQRSIAQGANQTGNLLAQKMGQAGIGGSGLGAISSSIVPSITGNALAGLQTGTYNQAQGQAQNSIQQQLQAILGQSGPSQNMGLFAGGLSAFGPLLQQYLSQGKPNNYNYGGGPTRQF